MQSELSFNVADLFDEPDNTMKMELSLTATHKDAAKVKAFLNEMREAYDKGYPYPARFDFLSEHDVSEPFPFEDGPLFKLIAETIPYERTPLAIAIMGAAVRSFPEVGFEGKMYNKKPHLGVRMIWEISSPLGVGRAEVEAWQGEVGPEDTNVPEPVILDENSDKTGSLGQAFAFSQNSQERMTMGYDPDQLPSQYRGANGKINPLSVCRLFSKDCLFFPEDGIAWDGHSHSISNIQSNTAKRFSEQSFWDNRLMLAGGAAHLMLELESDRSLVVPRDRIDPGLYRAIGEGDLTGITLFNLQARGRALTFLDTYDESIRNNSLTADELDELDNAWKNVEETITDFGMSALLDNPSLKALTRCVLYDERLSDGIPGFFRIVAKMYEDLLAYSGADSSYVLIFSSLVSFAPNPYIDGAERPVFDIAADPRFHIETNLPSKDESRNKRQEAKEKARREKQKAATEAELMKAQALELATKWEAAVKYFQARRRPGPVVIAISGRHALAVNAYGRCTAVGDNSSNQCRVAGWDSCVTADVGEWHSVALKEDGTCVANGFNEDGRCDVSEWRNVVNIAAGDNFTVALLADGTCRATGCNESAYETISTWRDITAIAAGGWHTVGLKADGHCVATGDNTSRQCKVSSWSKVTAVAAGTRHTVGLKRNGKCIATGLNDNDQCNVSSWKDVVAVAAGHSHTVALLANGTCVAVGSNKFGQCDVSGWHSVVAIAAGGNCTAAVLADGSCVIAGANKKKLCEAIDDWVLIRSGEHLAERAEALSNVYSAWGERSVQLREERRVMDERAAQLREEEAERLRKEQEAAAERLRKEQEAAAERTRAERRAAGKCQHCGGSFKGLFSKKCRDCNKPKDY